MKLTSKPGHLHIMTPKTHLLKLQAEQAWSAQVEQLSEQLKDAHASHAETQEAYDALNAKIRETETARRSAESERELAIKRRVGQQSCNAARLGACNLAWGA